MKFKFVNGPNTGSELEFRLTEITIGRDDCNILQLLTGGVSRYHASLKQTSDRGWVIYDQNSTNGVKVNGFTISGEKIVFDGDIITIGEQQLELSGLNFAPPEVEFQPIHTANTILPGHEVPVVQTAPGTSVQQETEQKETAKSTNPDKLLEELKKAGSTLFNTAHNNTNQTSAGTTSDSTTNNQTTAAVPKKKKLFNFIFYIALLICIVSGLKPFLFPDKKTQVQAIKAKIPSGLTLYYERIFYQTTPTLATLRMELTIENGDITCILDDIISRRHMVKKISAAEAGDVYSKQLDLLTQQLQSSGIFEEKNTPQIEHDVITICRRLTVVNNGKFASAAFYSDDVSSGFSRAQDAIINFLEQIGLSTTLQTREELEKAAAHHMAEANYSMENYMSDLSRLLDASRNYLAAIACYEQFQPPHPKLKEARRKLDAVNKLRKDQLRNLQIEFNHYNRLNDLQGMERICKEIMKISGSQSGAYSKAADTLRQIRQIQLNQKRSGR